MANNEITMSVKLICADKREIIRVLPMFEHHLEHFNSHSRASLVSFDDLWTCLLCHGVASRERKSVKIWRFQPLANKCKKSRLLGLGIDLSSYNVVVHAAARPSSNISNDHFTYFIQFSPLCCLSFLLLFFGEHLRCGGLKMRWAGLTSTSHLTRPEPHSRHAHAASTLL